MKQKMKNLTQQIAELNEGLSQQLPAEILETFGRSIQDLKTENIENNCIKTGDQFPDFSLSDISGNNVSLHQLLENGKVIIAFFRGSWCPYCNLELKALQDNLNKITDKKATLIAVSPQESGYSKELKDTHHLDFDVFTDKDNILAKQIGISFQLQDYAVPIYHNLGINLSDYNGNHHNELPVPAVFIIDTDFKVTYSFTDSNYMNRIDIQELIHQL